MEVRCERAGRIREGLWKLIIRRETDLERGMELLSPKRQRRLDRLGGERRADDESKRMLQI